MAADSSIGFFWVRLIQATSLEMGSSAKATARRLEFGGDDEAGGRFEKLQRKILRKCVISIRLTENLAAKTLSDSLARIHLFDSRKVSLEERNPKNQFQRTFVSWPLMRSGFMNWIINRTNRLR